MELITTDKNCANCIYGKEVNPEGGAYYDCEITGKRHEFEFVCDDHESSEKK